MESTKAIDQRSQFWEQTQVLCHSYGTVEFHAFDLDPVGRSGNKQAVVEDLHDIMRQSRRGISGPVGLTQSVPRVAR